MKESNYIAVKELKGVDECNGCCYKGSHSCGDFVRLRQTEGLPPCYDGFIYEVKDFKQQPPSLTEFINKVIPSALPMIESSISQFKSETGIDLDSVLDHNGNYNHSYVEWLESKLR